jgi:hypothetical protein
MVVAPRAGFRILQCPLGQRGGYVLERGRNSQLSSWVQPTPGGVNSLLEAFLDFLHRHAEGFGPGVEVLMDAAMGSFLTDEAANLSSRAGSSISFW